MGEEGASATPTIDAAPGLIPTPAGEATQVTTSASVPSEASTSASGFGAAEWNPTLPQPAEAVTAAENIVAQSQNPSSNLDIDPSMREGHGADSPTATSQEPELPSVDAETIAAAEAVVPNTNADLPPKSDTPISPIERGNNMYGLSDADAEKVGKANAWKPDNPLKTSPPSSEFSYANIPTGESGLTNTDIAPKVDYAIDSANGEDPNPGFETPLAVGSSQETQESAGIMTLAQIKELTESKRKVGIIENNLRNVLSKGDGASAALVEEVVNDSKESIVAAKNETNPNRLRDKLRRAIAPLVLVAAALGASGIQKDSGPQNIDNSTTDLGITAPTEQGNDIKTSIPAPTNPDAPFGTVTTKDGKKGPAPFPPGYSLQQLGGESQPVNPNIPPGAVIPTPPESGNGLSDEFKAQLAQEEQNAADTNNTSTPATP